MNSYLYIQGTRQEWQTVFFITCAIFFIGGLIFMLLSKGTVLSWADDISAVDNATLKIVDVDELANPRPMENLLEENVVSFKSTKVADNCV
jgi:hypothetical protein